MHEMTLFLPFESSCCGYNNSRTSFAVYNAQGIHDEVACCRFFSRFGKLCFPKNGNSSLCRTFPLNVVSVEHVREEILQVSPTNKICRRAPLVCLSPERLRTRMHGGRPPAPMNHVKIFKGWPLQDAPSLQLFYKSFPPGRLCLAEMKKPTMLSNTSSTA